MQRVTPYPLLLHAAGLSQQSVARHAIDSCAPPNHIDSYRLTSTHIDSYRLISHLQRLQVMSLQQIASGMMEAMPLYAHRAVPALIIPGELASAPVEMREPVKLYCSRGNPGAADIGEELLTSWANSHELVEQRSMLEVTDEFPLRVAQLAARLEAAQAKATNTLTSIAEDEHVEGVSPTLSPQKRFALALSKSRSQATKVASRVGKTSRLGANLVGHSMRRGTSHLESSQRQSSSPSLSHRQTSSRSESFETPPRLVTTPSTDYASGVGDAEEGDATHMLLLLCADAQHSRPYAPTVTHPLKLTPV